MSLDIFKQAKLFIFYTLAIVKKKFNYKQAWIFRPKLHINFTAN